MSRVHLPFWLFACSLITLLSVRVLVQQGMFMDGLLYTCVARNQAIGVGTFWFPQYDQLNIAGIPSFHEQPPLVFGIQSLFFRLLGDHLYVERLYTFLMLCGNGWLLTRLWRALPLPEEQRRMGWLPLVLWISVPVVFWSFGNNMHENTLSFFSLAAVYTGYLAHARPGRPYGRLLLSGLFVFLSTFAKGFPGFFPLVLPFAWWLAVDRRAWKKALCYFVVMAAVPALIYTVLLLLPVSGDSLRIYLYERALNRIGHMPTADYRLEIVWRTFTELLPPLLLTAILLLSGFKRQRLPGSFLRRLSLFFLLLGMAGSLPLALTMVQKGFYLVPSFPFYALALALLCAPAVARLLLVLAQKRSLLRSFSIGSGLLLLLSLIIVLLSRNQFYRDQELIEDALQISKVVPAGATMGLPVLEYDEYDFTMPGYLMRYNRQSLDPYQHYTYFLAEQEGQAPPPPGYVAVPLRLHRYVLYQRALVR